MNKYSNKIIIGPSKTNTKHIKLNCVYAPDSIFVLDQHRFADVFEAHINNDMLIIKRMDMNTGWGYNHTGNIIFSSNKPINNNVIQINGVENHNNASSLNNMEKLISVGKSNIGKVNVMEKSNNEINNIIMDNNRPKNISMNNNNDIIPKVIYQTWATKNLPVNMMKTVNELKMANSEFQHVLFDDLDCHEFIKNNFGQDVLKAYNMLIPGAYKADLWRYCVLYKNGGIYVDIKYKTINNFKLKDLLDREYYVVDRPSFFRRRNGIYNAFMVCKKGNKILLECINKIVENVNLNYYGPSPLYPTGPGLLGEILTNNNYYVDNILQYNGVNITYDKKPILGVYPEYRKEQQVYQNTEHYMSAWKKNRIYHQVNNNK